jgi:hypothetical protein
MIKVDSKKVLESSNSEIVASMVLALPKGSLLVALGLAELPKIGEKVVRPDSITGYATIIHVDLIGGTVQVSYTPIKYWKQDDSDWNWQQTEEYCVAKPAKSTTTNSVSFAELEYYTEQP